MAQKRTVKAMLSYDGTAFHGWQIQPGLRTIQGVIADTLYQITGEDGPVTGAGRTDAGVHALGQCASFKLDGSDIPDGNLLKAFNSLLPEDIRVLSLESVDSGFNARYSAVKKTYVYHIYNGEVLTPFKRNYVYHYFYRLDKALIDEGLKHLLGEHDFSAFRSSGCGARNPVKNILEVSVEGEDDFIDIEITADGFLQHMVRTIMGTLILIGGGKLPPDEMARILESRNRENAGPTAPARGLFLNKVYYE